MSNILKIKKRTNKSPMIREILNNEKKKKKEQKNLLEYSPEKVEKFKINTTCSSYLDFKGKLQNQPIKQHKEITTNRRNMNYCKLFNRLYHRNVSSPLINKPPIIITPSNNTKKNLINNEKENIIPAHLQNKLIKYNQCNEDFLRALEDELENEVIESSDED